MKRRTKIVLAVATALVSAGTVWFIFGGEDEEAARLRARQEAHFNAVRPKAAAGDINAQYALARLYYDGRGVARSPEAAARWYGRAAAKGNVRAQYALGRMYDAGDGIKQDFFKAAQYFTKAAEAGDFAPAQFALGRLHFHGRGVPNDYNEAFRWLDRAAAQGHPAGQFLMGAMHEDGWGVNRNLVEAYKWYTLAARRAKEVLAVDSHFDPVAARARIKKKMNGFQIDRATKRAKRWRPVAARPRMTFAAEGALSPGEKRQAEKKAKAETKEPIHLRLASFDAPIAGRSRQYEPVTMVLDVREESDVATVCLFEPRIRDTVLQAVSKKPLVLHGGRFDTDGLSGRLLGPINRAVGKGTVAAVLVRIGEVGDKRGVVTGLPFTTLVDCPAEAAGTEESPSEKTE